MGLRYSSADSASLMQAMRQNLAIANQITDRLSSGCDHLIATLDSGELKGAAYTAGRELFSEVMIPTIKQLQKAIDDIEGELRSYQYADSTISGYGTLDLENLERQIDVKWSQIDLIDEQLLQQRQFLNKITALASGNLFQYQSQITALENIKSQLQTDINELDMRVEKLKWFASDVSIYFSDSLNVLQLAIQGALALDNISLDSSGHYYSNGTNMDWLKKLKGSKFQTFDRGTDPKISLINQQIRDLMLPDEAASYYRKIMLGLLDGKPSSDWPVLIQAINHSLVFDDHGNILTIMRVNFGAGDGIIVLKNGKHDPKLTKQGNDELNSQFWDHLGDHAAQILAGLVQTIAGYGGALISLTAGLGGDLVVSLPSGGTLTIPVTLAAAAGTSASLAYAAQGSATLIDGLTQLALANQGLQLSFAQGYDDWKTTKPTSKPFGKPIEGRVNGRKSKIRVDAEPASNDIHIQTGGGKNSPLKRHIKVSKITDKKSIYKILKEENIPEVRSLSKGKLDELVNNIWNAFKWLKS